jgi:hypothetical protein
MKRLTHLFVLAAFIFSCGGQWYALQCVAWAKMIHDYAQMVPITEAVSMTFSGKYPCAMCQAITEKKASERDKTFALEKYDKKFFPPIAVAAAVPLPAPLLYLKFSVHLLTRTESPPTPPPRSVLG